MTNTDVAPAPLTWLNYPRTIGSMVEVSHLSAAVSTSSVRRLLSTHEFGCVLLP